MNLRGDSMDIVNICTAGLMLSSAALFAAFEDNGCSVRGTKKDILDTIRENT